MKPKIIYRNVKKLRLQISPEGILTAIAPTGMSQEKILEFVNKKKAWIARHMAKIEKNKKNALYTWLATSQLPLYGDIYTCIVAPEMWSKYYVDSESKIVRRWWGHAWWVKSLPELLRFHADAFLQHRLDVHAREQWLQYNKCYIRSQKTKRGTCSTKKNIWLNRRLIMCPIWIQDYVIVHELCHLIHMNHSAEYRAELKSRYARVDEARKWFKTHGNEVMTLGREEG